MSEEKVGFFQKLKQGLSKTRNNISYGLDSIFHGFKEIDDDLYDELEEVLITSDIGVNTTEEIIDKLKEDVIEKHIFNPEDLRECLIDSISEKMSVLENDYEFERKKSIVLVIGVNGVGKTTTIGKLAAKYKSEGKKVIMAAADTFRAAAVEQLTEWAIRAGVDIVKGSEGQDPASVVYDGINSFKAKDADLLLIDTAGRLQNKKNLMEELKKIDRIIERECPDAYKETLVVLDATTGQNALSQAKEFNEASKINGIILTKLDGSAKGGIVIAIQSQMKIPVKFVGVGEKIEDLQKFDSKDFVKALFDTGE